MSEATGGRERGGMRVERAFSAGGVDPFDAVAWEARTAEIKDASGRVIFRQEGCEFPAGWSQQAVNVVASKYFYGDAAAGNGSPADGRREHSARQLLGRVAGAIADWGRRDGYFASDGDAGAFRDDLRALLVGQYGSFNSPVWFNCGIRQAYGVAGAANGYRYDPATGRADRVDDSYQYPQISACLPYGALINTSRGLLPIGDIVLLVKRGEELHTYDRDGRPTRIVAGVCNGKRGLRSVNLADGGRLRLTKDHVVFVRDGDGVEREIQVAALKRGDKLILSRRPLLPEASDDGRGLRSTARLAWIAGVMVGNGYSGRAATATSDTWELKVNTAAERDRAAAVLDEYGVPYSVKEFHWGFLLRGYGAAGRAFWSRLDLWDRTHDKRVPDWVMASGIDRISRFLNGLFGTDGHVPEMPNGRVHVSLSNTSEQVVRTAQVLLRSIGIYAGLTDYVDLRTDAERKTCYTLTISDQQSVDRFAAIVGLTHSVKAERLAHRRGFGERDYRQDVVEVESVDVEGGAELVYDIQTESGTFWYEGVLVHNCFIGQVDDDLESIMEAAKTEAMLFKHGSGYGADLSTLRSTKEKLSGGGRPSGPVSFFRVYDTVASIIKSGGKTRRAARMQTLKCRHPDILEFIDSKVKEDRKARALIAAGYSDGMTGDADEAYSSVMFQNTNTAIRLTDEFMRKAAGEDPDATYWTRAVTTGAPVDRLDAGAVLGRIAASAWECGDPGVQFEDTIQAWHTLANTAPIHSSNPCSEYMSINRSACNLASINLMKFRGGDGRFDVDRYRAAVRIFAIAMDILVEWGSYPTPEIAENAYRFRQLGLGYANLGGLLMSWGLPYDSKEARLLAAALTGVLSGEAYRTSAAMAAALGPFEGFAVNEGPMRAVMRKHRDAALSVVAALDGGGPDSGPVASAFNDLPTALEDVWRDVVDASPAGFRNSQSCVIAPTGTIAFMMDCDTTGIEPELALVKYKALSGGGQLKIVNRLVPMALVALGYDADAISRVAIHVDATGAVEGAPDVAGEHLPVFDCAFESRPGGRALTWEAHVRMLAAVQPFVSGSISKTINLPASATVDDFRAAYVLGWRLGLKCMAVYRDGSKGQQPLTTAKAGEAATAADTPAAPAAPAALPESRRERLPATRRSVTHKFEVQGHEGYVTVGSYPDGRPGELFVTMAKEGSTIGGLMDVVGAAISIGLQYGVPPEVYVRKFAHTRFEPAGFTRNPDIPIAKSLADYIFRWIGMEFIPGYREANAPRGDGHEPPTPDPGPPPSAAALDRDRQFAGFQADAPPCGICGALTVRCGTCYRCANCGNSMGCS